MKTDALIRFEDVTVGYGSRPVLGGLSFSMPRGAFLGLLGANGSGKSTILRTLLGVLRPLKGRVILHPTNGRPPVLGYMPQRESLDPIFLMSSYEVALMGVYGRIRAGRSVPAPERDWARHCLEEAGAGGVAGRLFASLSGGQKQRVLMARALATRPDVLVLDEPTAGIDAAATQGILEVLERLHREQQVSILLVSHDLDTVRRHAQEVIWLHQGKLLQGAVSALLTREKIEEVLRLEL